MNLKLSLQVDLHAEVKCLTLVIFKFKNDNFFGTVIKKQNLNYTHNLTCALNITLHLLNNGRNARTILK